MDQNTFNQIAQAALASAIIITFCGLAIFKFIKPELSNKEFVVPLSLCILLITGYFFGGVDPLKAALGVLVAALTSIGDKS